MTRAVALALLRASCIGVTWNEAQFIGHAAGEVDDEGHHLVIRRFHVGRVLECFVVVELQQLAGVAIARMTDRSGGSSDLTSRILRRSKLDRIACTLPEFAFLFLIKFCS